MRRRQVIDYPIGHFTQAAREWLPLTFRDIDLRIMAEQRTVKPGCFASGIVVPPKPKAHSEERGSSVIVTIGGVTMNLSSWCRRLNADPKEARKRIVERKWPGWRALGLEPGTRVTIEFDRYLTPKEVEVISAQRRKRAQERNVGWKNGTLFGVKRSER
jgi:hypothetical protein